MHSIRHNMKYYLGPLPNIQPNPETRPFFVASNHRLNSVVPKAISSQCLAVAVRPVFCGGISILYLAPHGVTQELRRLLV